MSFFSRLFSRSDSAKPARAAPSMEEISRIVADKLSKERMALFPKLRDGFTYKSSGRCGYVYFKEAGRLIEFDWEMSGAPEYDILLWPEGVKEWILPERMPVTEEKQREILLALKAWLRKEGLRSDLETPDRGTVL